MSQEAWPTPQESSREPLPRVDDLPIAEHGYEQDSVRAAFDSFYRHAAQLDAALRTLEAVDSFHRQAAALRADIRTLRGAGWTQQPWSATPAYGYPQRTPREGLSPAVWRIAGEAAFLIAVAVVLGVAKLSWWLIVLVMAFAWLLVGLLEWAATRERFVASPVAEPVHPVVEGAAPAERADEEDARGWTAFEQSHEPSDAMTMIGAPPSAEEAQPEAIEATPPAAEPEAVPPFDEPEPEAVAEPISEIDEDDEDPPDEEPAAAEQVEAEHVLQIEASPEPEPEPRRRWWQRRQDEDVAEPTPEVPRHVRVLPADDADPVVADPWEDGLAAQPDVESLDGIDADVVAADGADDEPKDESVEDAAALAGDGEPESPRLFRRR